MGFIPIKSGDDPPCGVDYMQICQQTNGENPDALEWMEWSRRSPPGRGLGHDPGQGASLTTRSAQVEEANRRQSRERKLLRLIDQDRRTRGTTLLA